MKSRLLALALAAALVACGGSDQREVGVVIGVEGDLAAVDSFEVITGAGERLTFKPADGLRTFSHGGPLTHLTDHLRSGSPIRVTYDTDTNGLLIAIRVEDVEG